MKKIFFVALLLMGFGGASMAQTAAMPSSESVLANAYAKAAKENKKVFLIFHASWCGWCKKMEASLNDPACKKMFDDNYVFATLDVMEQPAKKDLENPGSLEVMTKLHGEKAGLPFWAILDSKGKVLADSQVRPQGASLDTYGENVGCPSEEQEVAFFTGILKRTSKLTSADMEIIAKRFAQNKPAPRAAAPAQTGK